jgi:mannose-6-phosphate isomerase-like protein (cupin superfamily)
MARPGITRARLPTTDCRLLKSNQMKLLAGAAVLLLAFQLHAQTPVEITAERHHHLVFENQYFRVFDVIVPSATLMHVHHHDYFFVTIGNADISNQIANWKPPTPIELQFKDGDTRFAPGNFAHTVRNLAKNPFHNITIEYLQDEQARQAPPVQWDEERGVHVLDGGTEEILFVKDGIRVSDIELQPKGVLPGKAQMGAHLLVAVTDLDLLINAAAAASSHAMHMHHFAGNDPSPRSKAPQNSMRVSLKSAEVKWFDSGSSPTLVNAGKSKARFIVLELH